MKVSVVQPVGNHFLLVCQVNLENPFRYNNTVYSGKYFNTFYFMVTHLAYCACHTHTQ